MMDQKRKPVIHLLTLLLLLSCLLPLGSSESLKQRAAVGEVSDKMITKDMAMEEEAFVNGRMDFESINDYPGSGANNRHDPRNPGRP
ncbi:uncharacterized protein [Typha angustifolia]|uniref:uncharacterized protein n=1 Tax=Typha angustifolia TaxID=59011 RepID=UPI003C3017A7